MVVLAQFAVQHVHRSDADVLRRPESKPQLHLQQRTQSVRPNCAAEVGTDWRCRPPSGREDLSFEADGRCPCTAAPRACAAAAPAADDTERKTKLCCRSRHRLAVPPPMIRER